MVSGSRQCKAFADCALYTARSAAPGPGVSASLAAVLAPAAALGYLDRIAGHRCWLAVVVAGWVPSYRSAGSAPTTAALIACCDAVLQLQGAGGGSSWAGCGH